MAFRIDYFRKGVKVGAVPYPGSREDTLNAAANGLDRHDADTARVLDMDHKAKEVGLVTR
jgi:hypothetical protein